VSDYPYRTKEIEISAIHRFYLTTVLLLKDDNVRALVPLVRLIIIIFWSINGWSLSHDVNHNQ